MLEARSSPVSIAALAESTGWHENTVRGHITALWQDGYLTRSSEERSGRGRPSWLWSLKEREDPPYAALAGVLAGALASSSNSPAQEAREAGRGWGRQLASEWQGQQRQDEQREDEHSLDTGSGAHRDVGTVRDRVIEVMRDQGFAPTATRAGEDADATIVLRQCPLITAVNGHQEVVCSVHLGMITGLIEAHGAQDGGSELTPFAVPGGCALRLVIDEAQAA